MNASPNKALFQSLSADAREYLLHATLVGQKALNQHYIRSKDYTKPLALLKPMLGYYLAYGMHDAAAPLIPLIEKLDEVATQPKFGARTSVQRELATRLAENAKNFATWHVESLDLPPHEAAARVRTYTAMGLGR